MPWNKENLRSDSNDLKIAVDASGAQTTSVLNLFKVENDTKTMFTLSFL